MFSFSYDPERTLLNVVQRGYWSMEIFRAYEAEYLQRHREILKSHPSYRVIAECRDFDVQSGEISVAFSVLFEKLMAENKGRYAIVAEKTLSKMQAKRALPQPNVQVFWETATAMAWLFEDDHPSG